MAHSILPEHEFINRGLHPDYDEDDSTTREDLPETGRVNRVRQEWMVHEDEVVAHKMQNEEFKEHFGFNRFHRRTTREGIQVAKIVQTEEEERAQIERMRELEKAREIEEADRQLAKEYQDYLEITQQRKKAEADQKIAKQVMQELAREEDAIQGQQAHKDEEIARQLQDKENEKYERYKEKRRAKELRKEREKLEAQLAQESEALKGGVVREDGRKEDVGDFSDFYIQPHPDMDAEEHKELQEIQDEELARLIQDQEHKRGANIDRDKLKQIEDQDAELARIIQEQEKIKQRKAREKRRLKSLEKQRSTSSEADILTGREPTRAKSLPAHHHQHSYDKSPDSEEPRVPYRDSGVHPTSNIDQYGDNTRQSDPINRPKSRSPDSSSERPNSRSQEYSTNDSYHSRRSNDSGGIRIKSDHVTSINIGHDSPPPHPPFHRAESYSSDEGPVPYRHPPPVNTHSGQTFNIAAAIDPTYNREANKGPDDPTFIRGHDPTRGHDPEDATLLNRGALPPTATLMRTGFIQEHWNPLSAQVAGDDGYWKDDDESFTGPIQGHRRTASGRKPKNKKEKEEKKSKCNQQ